MNQHRLKELFDYHVVGAFVNRTRRSSNSPKGSICRGSPVKNLRNSRYSMITVDGKTHLIHRLIFLWHNGYLPDVIDHIDRDRSNNRIENLRPSSPLKNQWNIGTKKHSRSGLKGVQWRNHANKWAARLRRNGKTYFLGYFDSPSKAASAVKKKECEFHC